MNMDKHQLNTLCGEDHTKESLGPLGTALVSTHGYNSKQSVLTSLPAKLIFLTHNVDRMGCSQEWYGKSISLPL